MPQSKPRDSSLQDILQEPGAITAALLDVLQTQDVIFLARDDVRAAIVARALACGEPDAVIVLCPASDALPGESTPPSPANAGRRTAAFRRLRAAQAGRTRIALISSGEAAARLYPSPEQFDMAPPLVSVGDEVSLPDLAAELEELGYFRDERVDEPGELAERGQVLDVFPADATSPVRIEVSDGSVVSVRPYDLVTQLTTDEMESVEIGRAREPDIGTGVTLLDHLPKAVIAVEPGAEERRKSLLAIARDTAQRRPGRDAAEMCADRRWKDAVEDHAPAEMGRDLRQPPPRFVEARHPMRSFARTAEQHLTAERTLVVLGSRRDLRFLSARISAALKRDAMLVRCWREVIAARPGSLLLLEMPVARGFHIGDIVAVAAADLLGSRAEQGVDHSVDADAELFRLGEIKLGDVVVHEDHGLSVVEGLEALPSGGDAIVLRFAADARRLVPVSEASRIWRYGADEDAVTLDKLDGSTWARRRTEVDVAIAESARSLTRLAADRMAQQAPVLIPDAAAYERFVAGFPFTETSGQTRAIAAVRDDLASGHPMDRLVIGDVGYGKTEVALRAAAMVALSGKQVALAAPTTVLVRQHLETFQRRFDGTGIEVAALSRLSTDAEKKKVRAGLADGSVRIVIGTGAVAGAAVRYDDLALVIIDEEQRFGAADKAKLRKLGAGHVLTLSATPIPRTLQQALVGMQQLSVIASPPARRQPIRTTIAEFDEALLRSALLRERSRGGQTFVVVPRIQDMAAMAERLSRSAAELDVLQAHGKMPAGEIDEAMVRFAAGDGDVLLATNIIEAGLDVPRANTMIIWRADRFGLSQLHQLRGRVGRGSRRGQVHLLTEAGAQLAPRTVARLNTLQAFDRLGAGFAISARDLDMRGAGDLLGEEQAGHVKLIGVDLYQHLLELALRKVRGETVDDWLPELNVGIEGRLSEQWIPEADVRLGLYVRLARLRDLGGIASFEEELADRFGELPDEAARLVAVARLRALARSGDVRRLDAGPAAIAVTPSAPLNAMAKKLSLRRKGERYLLAGDFEDERLRMEAIETLLSDLVAAEA